MGIKIKRKFFGIDYENYVYIENLSFNIINILNEPKNIYWDITFKICFNEESRDIEKFCEQFHNKKIKIEPKNEKEMRQLDTILSVYNPEVGVGHIGSMTLSIDYKKFLDKNKSITFFKENHDDVFTFFYKIIKNYANFLGAQKPEDVKDLQEDNEEFKKRMTDKVKNIMKGE